MTAYEVPFDRARFDESIELARTQLAFPLPDPDQQTDRETKTETEDEERER